MFDVAEFNSKSSNAHYYMEYAFKNEDSIKERLRRSIQHYHSAQSQIQLDTHKNNSEGLHDIMYRIDFPKNLSGKVVIDMSFTYLHWKVAEALGNEDSKFNIEKMEDE